MASAVYSDFDIRTALNNAGSPPSHYPTPIGSPNVPATPINTPASNLSTPGPSSPLSNRPLSLPPMESVSPASESPCHAPQNTPVAATHHGAGVISPLALEALYNVSPYLRPSAPPNSPEAWAKDRGDADLKHENFEDGYEALGERLTALGLGTRNRAHSAAVDQPAPPTPSQIMAPDSNEYYEVKSVPNKGYGCFALKSIPRGTRILADEPLIYVKEQAYYRADIEREFEKLSAADKKLFFSLYSAHNQDPDAWPKEIHETVSSRERQRIQEQQEARFSDKPTVTSIFQTNCMPKDTGAAVFPHASRFNHSCNPNATFTWNPAIGKETIHAVRDIKPGEEITLAYCDIIHSKPLRKWELKHYGFTCDCPACDATDPWAEKSAERRAEIGDLERETEFLSNMREESALLSRQYLTMIKLLIEEGDYSARLATAYRDLGLVLEEQFKRNNERQELVFALSSVKKGLQIRIDCHGSDHPIIAKYTKDVDRITAKLAQKDSSDEGKSEKK